MSVIKQELAKRKRFTVVGFHDGPSGGGNIVTIVNHVLASDVDAAESVASAANKEQPTYVVLASFAGYQSALRV